ncbi:alpha/beta hydrolase [Halpernia sp.]|uniref:alpha/beta hydrolase n=1 Tax=Halpernia sp. TaxID=2782209 RepID=UPI003A9268F2
MEKLIILSDLWGSKKSDWIANYTTILKSNFEIKYYDCCELGEINLTDYSEENIHQQFINGGIDKAVQNLLKEEKGNSSVLGFSIGGFIAWKTACEGLEIKELIAVSSTRLRYENQKPNCSINLIYGENDYYKPNNSWFNQLNLQPKIYKKEEHNFYMKKEKALEICDEIIKN